MVMRHLVILCPLVLFFSVTTIAQIAIPSPTPTPRPGSRQANVHPIVADNDSFDRMRSIEMITNRNSPIAHPMLDPKKGIYRRPSKEETASLAVAEPLLVKHAELLRDKNAGIVKLNADSSCVSDVDVVVATEKCIPFKMPGAGIAYSFRTESYRLPRLADLILHDGIFKTGGAFQQVIMADLGDLPLEAVTLGTNGLKFLTDLKPVSDSNEFTKFEQEIVSGIKKDGFFYRKGQLAKENTTYVLRSIAYRGKYMRSVEGVDYDELEFDRRRDTIVAFRVVEKDPAGNMTILWKRLKDAESPVLKIVK